MLQDRNNKLLLLLVVRFSVNTFGFTNVLPTLTSSKNYKIAFSDVLLSPVSQHNSKLGYVGLNNIFLHERKFESDFPSGDDDEYSSEIDWDAEWKKVVAKKAATKDIDAEWKNVLSNQGQSTNRPKGNYKSEVELAAIKARKEIGSSLSKLQNKRLVPDFRMLKGDWKFWIGLLAIISIGTSLISAAGTSSYNDDVFYI